MIGFTGSHFEKEIILWGVRWYVADPISYRQLGEIVQKHGIVVDHATLNRWVIKYAPKFGKQFRRRQQPVGGSWRMDETYVRVKGEWKYLCRAVDKEGHIIDVLLTPHRDRDAAEAFLHKAMRTQGFSEKKTIDQNGRNTAAMTHYNNTHQTAIAIRQCQYLNNMVEQDHWAVKRKVRRCEASHRRGRPGVRSLGLKSCTLFARDNWHPLESCPTLRQRSVMPWLRR